MAPRIQVLPRSSTMVEKLNRLYSSFNGDDRVLVVINADPDAISSAMALKRLLWRRVSSVTIVRTNVIKRPDNLALINYIKLPLVHINEVKTGDFSRLAMVDSQPQHIESVENYKFDVIVDHHPLGEYQAPFLDVRPDYGATATMMTEYLRAAKISPSRNLATALFYGIKTDTANFVRQGQIEDMRAFRFLFPLINQNLVRKIENSEITRSNLKHLHRALERVKIKSDTAFVFMDRVDNPDTLVMLADFFMRVHDIDQTVAAGVFKDQVVVIFRAIGRRTNAGKWAAESFGQVGSAGGHQGMARAEIPLARLDSKVTDKGGALERYLVRETGIGRRTPQKKSS
jgi:nanoRNase/pAp phosphatase (c-di-AMP/oligoRNAs hydrolase)